MNKVHIKQIEELTERRISNILFDSDVDDWNRNTSVFEERIWNKEHIIIIIEDEEENKFGGYVNEKIDKNERMMKFDIKQSQYAFTLLNKSHVCLFAFGFGYDICVRKENDKTLSHCKQSSFEYEGISNALCGKELPKYFTQNES
ncbi:trichohyalin, putative [Entamoeba histolytica]